MGIENIGSLSSMAPEMLQSILGKHGIDIWKKANGIYFSPVVPYSEEKSISTEQTFETDTFDRELLERILIGMTEKIAFRLRKRQKQASVVTVKIRYSNFDTFTQQKKIAYTSLDHLLINTALELFRQLCQSQMPVRLVGVRLGGLISGVQQLDLFDNNEKMIRLYSSMDQIRTRFGAKAVRRASGISRNLR
jgi:DNA polymerase-4